ncbi:MAG: PIG-L family deacetylase [Pseudomonadota bacterium]
MSGSRVSLPDFFVPDGTPLSKALKRTTHLGVGAHPDDLEILAIHGILECYRHPGRFFTGVVLTDGAGGPRNRKYSKLTKEAYVRIRQREQKRAARLGRYGAILQLGFSSAGIKGSAHRHCLEQLKRILAETRPGVIYTHSLADDHDTHAAAALLTIQALRKLRPHGWPKRFYGCEVWRSLDWLPRKQKAALDAGARPALSARLLGIFRSQIAGGKRYDLATLGRRMANATFAESHDIDRTAQVTFAMDLRPLLRNPGLDPARFVRDLAEEFGRGLVERVRRLR